MSLSGLRQFEDNLRTLTESNGFKSLADEDKLKAGYSLYNSKYGIGPVYRFSGKVTELKV